MILVARDIHKRYGNANQPEVLRGIDLQLRAGEFVAIMGPSGCGKSTLLHILGLMLRPSKGQIEIDGQTTSELTENERAKIRGEKIGFVFQRFNLVPVISAEDNLKLALRIRGGTDNGRVEQLLAEVGLAQKARRKPEQLSMGEQQRVAIARAIVHNPSLVLADEPTGNLDSDNAAAILVLLRKMHEQHGQTTLIITHDKSAADVADKVLLMKDGRLHG